MEKNKKRVLLVSCDDLSNGGVQNVIMNIVRELHDEYAFDIILNTKKKSYYEDEFVSYGGKIYRIEFIKSKSHLLNIFLILFRWIRNYNTINKIFKDNRYIAVHCNNDLESWYILKAAMRHDIGLRISHNHRIIGTTNKFFIRLYISYCAKKIVKYSTCIVGCSKESLDYLDSNGNQIIIDNPFNSMDLKYNKKNDNDFSIIQIGSYSKNKNQLFSLKVFKEILSKYHNASLVFIGFDNESGYVNQMKSEIERMRIENNVLLLPHNTEKQEALSNSSYMLFPSIEEGFGIVLVEAQAVGLKCFVSDSVPKSVNCGGCVYLPLSAGPKKWADTIIDDYIKTHGEHIKYDCSRFDLKKIANIYRDLYEGKLNE